MLCYALLNQSHYLRMKRFSGNTFKKLSRRSLFIFLSILICIKDIQNMEPRTHYLAQNTHAYYQVYEKQKTLLIDLFIEIASDILTNEPN